MYYQQQISGHCLILSSDALWLQQSYVEDSWLNQDWLQGDLCQASRHGYHCRIWQAKKGCSPITYILNLYRSADHGLRHMWSFASYLDDIDLSMYFAKRSESFKLFATRFMQLCHHYLYPDRHCYVHNKQFENNELAHAALLTDLIQKTPLKNFPIVYKGQEISITHMEAICLPGISDGKTAKLIGRDTGLSYRTVEKHVEFKEKFLFSLALTLFICLSVVGIVAAKIRLYQNLKNDSGYAVVWVFDLTVICINQHSYYDAQSSISSIMKGHNYFLLAFFSLLQFVPTGQTRFCAKATVVG